MANQKKINISLNESQWREVIDFYGYEPAPNELKQRLLMSMSIQSPDEKAGRKKSSKVSINA